MSNKDFENGLALGLSVGTGYKGDNFPDNYVKVNKYATTLENFFYNTGNLPAEIILDISNCKNSLSFANFLYGNAVSTDTSLKTLTIIGDTSKLTSFSASFYNRRSLVTINGILDFSHSTTLSSTFNEARGIANITVKPNTILISIALRNSSALTNDSVISVANGLNASAVGQTLTLHATPKARCATLMGNVNADGLFVADENGTISLETFITSPSYKNWTLA